MFEIVADPEVQRLVAAAPDWPPLDEVFDRYPPAAPSLDDELDDLSAGPEDGGCAPRLGVVADLDPSGWAALDLDTVTDDPAGLGDDELIDAMVGFGRVEAWAQARQTRLVAEFDRRRPGSAARWAADEVGLAMAISRVVASGRLTRARRLVDTLTDTLELFEAGRIDDYKARLIVEAVARLDDTQAVWVQDRVLHRAGEQSPAQLRAALARAVIAADPDGANERHRKARTDRRVVLGVEDDGMASLWALLSAADAQSVHHTLTGLARGLGAEDPRGMDARRADLLVALLRGELSLAHATDPAVQDPAVQDPAAEPSGDGGAGDDGVDPGRGDETRSDDGPTEHNLDDRNDGDGGSGDSATAQAAAAATAERLSGGESSGGESSGGEGSDDEGSNGEDSGNKVSGGGSAGGEWCAGCAAQAWWGSRPRLRPVNPGKPLVHVVMAHSTLRGADHAPAELVGYGPICAEAAREIAGDAVWRRLIYDEETGALLDYGRRTYRPPAALADHVRARDGYCRSPLCRRRAIDGELDHTVPFPEGPTADHNLTDGCVWHHHEKHAPGWAVVQHPDGRLDWITPTGHTYTSEVHDYRPLPPPPAPHIPGPVADRTHTQPPSPTPAARPPRPRYDGSGTDTTAAEDSDPAPV